MWGGGWGVGGGTGGGMVGGLHRSWRMPAGRGAYQQLKVDVAAEPLSIVVFPWPSPDCKRSGCSELAVCH